MARAYCTKGIVLGCVYDEETDTYTKADPKNPKKWDTKIYRWRNYCMKKCTMTTSKLTHCRYMLRSYTRQNKSTFPKCPQPPKGQKGKK